MTKRIPILLLALVVGLCLLAAASLADPAEHEHDYTAGWKFFQTPAEAAGFANSPSWNLSMSHGMVAKCSCGATNPQYNVWTEAHNFDENGVCTKCGYERILRMQLLLSSRAENQLPILKSIFKNPFPDCCRYFDLLRPH